MPCDSMRKAPQGDSLRSAYACDDIRAYIEAQEKSGKGSR